jgi:prevent-host-death family protein
MWSVQDAKSRLSEVLRRARAGEPQTIGTQEPCVVLSADDYAKSTGRIHLGRFLIESAPRGEELDIRPCRSRRGDPFRDRTKASE